MASSGLHELVRLAEEDYGLTSLRAMTTDENLASRRVLEKAGFLAGAATTVAGRPGTTFRCDSPTGWCYGMIVVTTGCRYAMTCPPMSATEPTAVD